MKICRTHVESVQHKLSVTRWDLTAATVFSFFVAVKSESQFIIRQVFLYQCGKADTIKDYTGGEAHTCFQTPTD